MSKGWLNNSPGSIKVFSNFGRFVLFFQLNCSLLIYCDFEAKKMWIRFLFLGYKALWGRKFHRMKSFAGFIFERTQLFTLLTPFYTCFPWSSAAVLIIVNNPERSTRARCDCIWSWLCGNWKKPSRWTIFELNMVHGFSTLNINRSKVKHKKLCSTLSLPKQALTFLKFSDYIA